MASDVFLKIEDVPGESQDHKHAGEIEILSWSWSEVHDGRSRGRGTGRVQRGDLVLQMEVCSATPKLMEACAKGQRFESAILTCRRRLTDEEAVEYLVIELTHVYVSSYDISGDVEGMAVDGVSLSFAKMEMLYVDPNSNNLVGSYDFEKNTGD